MDNIYLYEASNIDGKLIKMEDFRNHVLLIVNTASECGFTQQYQDLEALYISYRNQDFSILGFPCNQFGNQEPKDNQAIARFCQSQFGISFPMFEKIEVNGKNSLPLFSYIKEAAPGLLSTISIKWNFTKFLIRRNGTVYKRYAPIVSPKHIGKDIEFLLNTKK